MRRRHGDTRKGLLRLVTMTMLMLSTSGCVYFSVKTPLDTDLDETRLGEKVGVSQAHSILGLVAWGDAGTQAAAEAGGITTIRHADQQLFAVLTIVYARYRTIVYGD